MNLAAFVKFAFLMNLGSAKEVGHDLRKVVGILHPY